MLEEPKVELQQVTGAVEGENLVLDVKVFNPEDRTLYAYGTPRRIEYDGATRTLTVSLHDQHVDADHPIAPHLPQPRLVPLEGKTVTDLNVTLPRVVRRIRTAAERGGAGPITEEQPIFEATTVTIELAHQDTPLYYNPRLPKVEQFKQWGEQIATITTNIQIDRGGYG